MMKKVDCHALQGKARNDRKRASFLNTPQDLKTPTKDSRISKETSANAERCPLFCDEKTSEAVQGEAEAGFFSKSLLCEHSQGRALGVRNRRECEAIKDLSRKAESTSKAIGARQ